MFLFFTLLVLNELLSEVSADSSGPYYVTIIGDFANLQD